MASVALADETSAQPRQQRFRTGYIQETKIANAIVKAKLAEKNGRALDAAVEKILNQVSTGEEGWWVGIEQARRAEWINYVTADRLKTFYKNVAVKKYISKKKLPFITNKDKMTKLHGLLNDDSTTRGEYDRDAVVAELEALQGLSDDQLAMPWKNELGIEQLEFSAFSSQNWRALCTAIHALDVQYRKTVTEQTSPQQAVSLVRAQKQAKKEKDANTRSRYARERKRLAKQAAEDKNRRARRHYFRDKTNHQIALQNAASATSLGLMALSYATKNGLDVSPATKKRLLPQVDLPSPPTPPPVIDLTALDSDADEANVTLADAVPAGNGVECDDGALPSAPAPAVEDETNQNNNEDDAIDNDSATSQ